MTVLNGTSMLIYDGATAIAATKDCKLVTNQNLPDTSTKDSGGWAEHLNGLRDYTVEFGGLYDPSGDKTIEDIQDAIINRTQITFKISTEVATETYWTGTIDPTTAEVAFPMEDASTCSGSFRGDGELTKDVVSA